MKKFALLLALLMLLGTLAACSNEDNTVTVPGYQIHIPTDGKWTVAEETDYDLEMTSGKLRIRAVAYVPTDFVDPPTAEDLYDVHNGDLYEQYTDLTAEEETTSYNRGKKTIWTTMYGSGDEKLYSCMVSVGNEAESCIWMVLSGPAKDVEDYRSEFKSMLEDMTCDATPLTPEDLDEAILDEEFFQETEPVEDPGTPTE